MDRHQLESAAMENAYLRGGLLVPAGLLCFLAALGNWQVGVLRHSWVFVGVLLLIGALSTVIYGYYNAHYGKVVSSSRQQKRVTISAGLGIIVTAGGSTLLRSRAPWSLDLPVNTVAATLAVAFGIAFAATVGLKSHHVVILGALLVSGLLPVWNGADPSNIGLVMVGVALVVIGIFDHILLVRTFGSPTPEGENGARTHDVGV
jgi:hypothetical protein